MTLIDTLVALYVIFWGECMVSCGAAETKLRIKTKLIRTKRDFNNSPLIFNSKKTIFINIYVVGR